MSFNPLHPSEKQAREREQLSGAFDEGGLWEDRRVLAGEAICAPTAKPSLPPEPGCSSSPR